MKNEGMRYKGLCAAFLLLLAGCSETDTVRISGQERSIGFTTGVTRAAKEDFGAGDAFAVWGWYTPQDAFSQVFDATRVSTSDGVSWSYENLRFWKSDKTYDFYGLYPSLDELPGTAAYNEDGMLTVTGFDASQQVDLMAASVSAMNGSLSAPVSFSFTHLLSRIQIVGKRNEATVGIEGFMPRIHEVKLYGMPGSGGLSINAADLSDKTKILSSWTGSDVTTSDSPLIVFRSDTGAEVTTEGTLLIDVLPLPQYITRDYYVEVEYSTNGTSGEHKTATIQLNSLPVTKWEVGRQYRYTFSVLDDDRILFDIPTVNAWDEAVGGIIIVD